MNNNSQDKRPSTLSLSKYLNTDNKNKALKLRGLPFNTSEDEIMEFFKNYNVVMDMGLLWVEEN